MARKSTSSVGSRPSGVRRKSSLNSAREKKAKKRRSSASSRRQSTRTDVTDHSQIDETVPDLEDMVTDDEEESTLQENRQYVYLKPKIKRIPQEKITSEWKSINPIALEKVREIFTTARRKVVNDSKSAKRAAQVEEAVNGIMQLLMRRMPRAPFPPRTKEMSFDLEKLVQQRSSLESEMDTAKHSIELLKAEYAKEEELLQRDQSNLETLQNDAKLEEKFWQTQVKKKYSLLESTILKKPSMEDSAEAIGFEAEGDLTESVFDIADETIGPLLDQLHSHLESIKTNHMQVEGVNQAMREAGIAIDGWMQNQKAEIA